MTCDMCGYDPCIDPSFCAACRRAELERKQSQDSAPLSVSDFYAYMPKHAYLYVPTRELWATASVNARLGKIDKLKASAWLDSNRPIEQMTWAPGKPQLIENLLVAEGGWINKTGAACFNLYRPPVVTPFGEPDNVGPWLDHVRYVYPTDADHIVRWCAHRVQKPHDKINHALVLGGAMGIGKDTLLEPVKRAVGPWNFHEVSPSQMLGRFNGFLKAVVLRISEARDLGDVNRFQFYDHMKAYTAAPPDVLHIDEKFMAEQYIVNCCGIVITTNYKADGIFLPADDRRHYVAWSTLSKDDFTADYWNRLWGWYEFGGFANVAAYLRALDLASFDAKAPPPKTPAFWDIVDASRAPEDAELADTLDEMGRPAALTLASLIIRADSEFALWLKDRKNRRIIPYRLERCEYVSVRNDTAKDGLWKIAGKRQVVYAKTELTLRDRIAAANRLCRNEEYVL